MSLYTRTGDDGTTGLFGNRRVPKDHARIEAYGTVDELNCVLGLVRAEVLPSQLDQRLVDIQEALFELGADLATEGGRACLRRIEPGIRSIESWIDECDRSLPVLRSFILPAGTRAAALLHLARTVARRAERRFWTLVFVLQQEADPHTVPEPIGIYLNRLSDLLFVLARDANRRDGVADTPWIRQP